MSRARASAVCLAALVLCSSVAIAEVHDHAGLGKVSFPVSCNPEGQKRFNTAASLLYSFYWEEIDAAVADVLAADSNCAMAYWIKAVASLDNALGSPPTPKQEKAGWEAAEKAKQLGAKTQRERDYIAAVEVVFKDYETVPFQKRAVAYEKALEQIYQRYPEDSEAAVLYAFWLQVTADRNDQTFAQQLKSATIAEKVFVAQPQHPGAARSGDSPAAKIVIARLETLRDAMAAQKKDYWVEQAAIQIDTVTAWLARAEHRNDEALKLMQAAADREDKTEKHIMMPGRVAPVREMLGELLLELQQPASALAAFEESQRADPNRFRNVFGAAHSASLTGNRENARMYYARLLAQVGPRAGDRKEIAEAKAFLSSSR